MLTRDILSVLGKSTGVALVSTATAVGAVGIYSSIANVGVSIPKDGDECLDVLANLRRSDTARVLWSLLACVPGFLFGSLYFLCRLKGSVCPDPALEYDTIDDDQGSCLSKSLDGMSNFFTAVVTSDKLYKVIFKAIIVGLSVLGVLYGIVTASTSNVDRKVFLPEKCQDDLRGDIILDLSLSLIILVMISGPILMVGCNRNCASQKETNGSTVVEVAENERGDLSYGQL